MTEDTRLSDVVILAQRDAAIEQIKFARAYIRPLIDSVDIEDWYRIPTGSVSHLAWQVGHLTVAQYGLLLFRQRGRAENDSELMPSPLRKRFGKGSDPTSVTVDLYTPEKLLSAMQAVYDEALTLLPTLTADQLWEPEEMPYAGYPRKLGSILFCPMHEMLHAGQIGALRRSLGLVPVR